MLSSVVSWDLRTRSHKAKLMWSLAQGKIHAAYEAEAQFSMAYETYKSHS